MFHDETSEARADSPWAKLALGAEKLLEGTETFVARTCAYGWSAPGAEPGFAEKMWDSLSSARALDADGVRYASPILASDLAELLAQAYQRRLHGLYHLAGAERCSPFRFASELAGVFGLSQPRLRNRAVTAESDGPAGETSLSSRRASRALGLPLPTLREGLYRFADQHASGWAPPRQQSTKTSAELCNHAA
jgi:dTDP-4-dehydrorhamnose reductase